MEELYEKCLKNSWPIQQNMEENLYSIRVLDVKMKMAEEEIRKKLNQMVNTWKKTSTDERRRQFGAIEKLFENASNLSREKIQLAEHTYEMVDAFIQKLDKDTNNYNTFVQHSIQKTADSSARIPNGTLAVKSTPDVLLSSAVKRRGTAPAASLSSHITKRGVVGWTNTKETSSSTTKAASGDSGTGASGVQLVFGKGDMPIDPNEPRYCICHQVSFGHMVGCDNKDCPVEWFHFDCVGLNASPKGKWYCPQCREDKDSQSTRRQQQKTQKGAGGRGKDISAGGRG